MEFINLLIVIGAGAVIWHIVSSILIFGELRKKEIPVNFFLIRLFMIKYATQSKEITTKETGKVGVLFYHLIISINIALVSAVGIALIKIL